MNSKLSPAIIGALMISTLVVASCSSNTMPQEVNPATPTSSATDDESESAASASELEIAMINAIDPIAFSQTVMCGGKTAGSELGVRVTTQGPTEFSPQKQIPILEAVVNKGVDGIIIDPTDSSALINPIQAAQKKGVTVITNDVTLNEPVATAQFTTSNVDGGALAAGFLTDGSSGGSLLVVSWDQGVSTSDDRISGFTDAASKVDGFTILPVQYAHNDPAQAAQITEAAIRANPDLVGIFATNDGVANGVATGLKNSGKTGAIRLVAYDADTQQVEGLRNGEFDALIAQGAFEEGYEAVKLMVEVLTGEVDKADVKFEHTVDNMILTKDNIDSPDAAKFIYSTDCAIN